MAKRTPPSLILAGEISLEEKRAAALNDNGMETAQQSGAVAQVELFRRIGSEAAFDQRLCFRRQVAGTRHGPADCRCPHCQHKHAPSVQMMGHW